MTDLINLNEQRYVLGVDSMDRTHSEFICIVNQLACCTDKADFMELFLQLHKHTEEHFSAELELMKETGFPAINEHNDAHLRLLGEMYRFGLKVSLGNKKLGQAYIIEQLPGWFELHAATMDSALAAHIKSVTLAI